MKKHLWKIVIGLAVLIFAGSIVYSQQAAKEANEGVTIEAHVKGNPDAQVTLVEYSDFQCPACQQLYPHLKEVMDEHGDKISLEYRHFPLISVHPYAVPAARASEAAAQQGKFWEMHDKLFEEQSAWSKSSNPEAMFVGYAEEIGLDTTLFKKHMSSSIINDAITESFNDARKRNLSGTPSLFLNGEEMEINTFDDFKAQVEAAIAGAN